MSSAAESSWDVFQEVQNIVKEAVENAGTQYHTGVLAVEIRDQIRDQHPELWDIWIHTLAVDAIKTVIGRIRTTSRTRRSVFSAQRSAFDLQEEVDASHTQRRIGDMVKSDLEYVSRSYLKRANTFSLRGRRFAALSQRMPDEVTKVRDVPTITEEEVASIFLNGE